MGDRERLTATLVRELMAPTLRAITEEAIRLERERRRPINRAARAIGGVWRTIVSGGWE